MKRPLSLTFLLLAYLATLVAPLRTAWACPDGTACVPNEQKRFACAGNQCATEKSCCVREHQTACKHGAFPSSKADEHSGHSVQSPDHCRFTISAPTQLTALTVQSAAPLVAIAALLVPFFRLPEAVYTEPVWRSEQTLGYRPPPILSTGPSRAPPTA